MKVAIIGATGFIGRHLCEKCVERGDSVTALVRNSYAEDFFIRNGASTVRAEITEESLVSTCAGADVVFNLAGALGKWGKSREEMEFVNSVAPGMIVACASKCGATMVVHASTAGVSGPLPDGTIASEETESKPVTDYQQTKFDGEIAALREHERVGIPLVIVRPAFVYGPGDMHKLSLFKATRKRRMVLVNGGRSLLHPVHVNDLVDGMLLAAERAQGRGEAIILAGPKPASTREIVRTIALSVKVAPPGLSAPEGLLLGAACIAEAAGRLIGKEPPLTRSRVKLLSENYAYSTKKAETEIGFRPSIQLANGIEETARWYLDHGFIR